MRKKRFFKIIIRLLVTVLGAAGANAQSLLIRGPDGRAVEIRRTGGFRLSLPGRPRPMAAGRSRPTARGSSSGSSITTPG